MRVWGSTRANFLGKDHVCVSWVHGCCLGTAQSSLSLKKIEIASGAARCGYWHCGALVKRGGKTRWLYVRFHEAVVDGASSVFQRV